MKTNQSVLFKATFLLSFVFFSQSFSFIYAQPNLYAITAGDSGNDIQFVRAQDGLLVFDLNLTNLPDKGSFLQIKDEEGNVIFEQKISTETFTVRYKIERNNMSQISFEVSGKKTRISKSFKVYSYVEEKIAVAKL